MAKDQHKPEIIIFDLETMPNPKEALKVWPQLSNYPGLTLKASITSIICAGYKYLGEKTVHCINAWDFPEWKKDKNNDLRIVKALYEVLKNADAIVTQNGKKFDWKYFQTRLMINGLKPLNKIPHIDTRELASRNLFLFNNRLNTIGEFLVNEKKLDHEGWDLWVKVFEDDKASQNKMTKYCKQDVRLTEKAFIKLRPFANNIPNHNHWSGDILTKKVCPNCGSEKLKSWGWRYTKTKAYRRMRCRDCHSFSRLNLDGESPRSIL